MSTESTVNVRLMTKLAAVAVGMFAFGYLLVPLYKAFCDWTGVNVLALGEREATGSFNARGAAAKNTQVDYSRTVVVEFDTNSRGPWTFRPEMRQLKVHPGELSTVMFDLQNVQGRSMTAQAIPSYAPAQVQSYFNKLECFCFVQHTLAPGERKRWPVVFYISPKLPRDVHTVTLSYTFFEIGQGIPTPAQIRSQAPEDGLRNKVGT